MIDGTAQHLELNLKPNLILIINSLKEQDLKNNNTKTIIFLVGIKKTNMMHLDKHSNTKLHRTPKISPLSVRELKLEVIADQPQKNHL